jgi:hypothetical protein
MRYLRTVVIGLIVGLVLVGSVWAGTVLGPVQDATSTATKAAPRVPLAQANVTAAGAFDEPLPAGQLLAGAAKISTEPAPDASKGEVWLRDATKCTPLTSGDVETTLDHAADWRLTWIENNNCIYMGGFGIGPSQPVLEWDHEYGLWVRSAAFVRDGKAIVLTIIDGEGYFGRYRNMCPDKDNPCGSLDISEQLATETGLDKSSFVFASTHAHSAMDFIGGWGGVPPWYMRQVSAALKSSVRQALGVDACPADQDPAAPTCIPLQPATVEAGEVLARGLNGERRDSYRSAEDPSLNWIRARTADTGAIISTVGTFAAHATSFGDEATKAHADWPGVFEKTVETRFGGIGLALEAGLGNMSSRGGFMMGRSLGELVPVVGAGTAIADPVVRSKQEFWDQPVTNMPLGTLGAGGFFDRPFGGPAVVEAVKPGWNIPCRSAGPTSVNVAVTAARIGGVFITAAPGEVFANFSNTLEERAPVTTLAIGQANDALGYMPQSFETDDKARQGGGFIGDAHAFEYEDAYSIDRCFGDKALETTIKLLGEIVS